MITAAKRRLWISSFYFKPEPSIAQRVSGAADRGVDVKIYHSHADAEKPSGDRVTKKLLINLALFQIGWMVCVIGGNLYAVGFTVLALLVHRWQVMGSRAEWKLIGIVVLVGCLWDITMARTGVIHYADADPLGIPLWLVCLWILFATTFMHGLYWLSRHLGLAAVFAGVLGPASYWFGSRLTDAELGLPLVTSVAVMAAGWAVLFPCGIYYAGRLRS